jgi:hypothetical protein
MSGLRKILYCTSQKSCHHVLVVGILEIESEPAGSSGFAFAVTAVPSSCLVTAADFAVKPNFDAQRIKKPVLVISGQSEVEEPSKDRPTEAVLSKPEQAPPRVLLKPSFKPASVKSGMQIGSESEPAKSTKVPSKSAPKPAAKRAVAVGPSLETIAEDEPNGDEAPLPVKPPPKPKAKKAADPSGAPEGGESKPRKPAAPKPRKAADADQADGTAPEAKPKKTPKPKSQVAAAAAPSIPQEPPIPVVPNTDVSMENEQVRSSRSFKAETDALLADPSSDTGATPSCGGTSGDTSRGGQAIRNRCQCSN